MQLLVGTYIQFKTALIQSDIILLFIIWVNIITLRIRIVMKLLGKPSVKTKQPFFLTSIAY